MEEIQFVKNHTNFDVNISFLENIVKKGFSIRNKWRI